MIFPIAFLAAAFVNQVAQAPLVVQCPQATPDPWWKWLFQTIVPVAGGTMIAVWSFVANRKSE